MFARFIKLAPLISGVAAIRWNNDDDADLSDGLETEMDSDREFIEGTLGSWMAAESESDSLVDELTVSQDKQSTADLFSESEKSRREARNASKEKQDNSSSDGKTLSWSGAGHVNQNLPSSANRSNSNSKGNLSELENMLSWSSGKNTSEGEKVLSWSNLNNSSFVGKVLLRANSQKTGDDEEVLAWSNRWNSSDDNKMLAWSSRANVTEGKKMLLTDNNATGMSWFGERRNSSDAPISWSQSVDSDQDENDDNLTNDKSLMWMMHSLTKEDEDAVFGSSDEMLFWSSQGNSSNQRNMLLSAGKNDSINGSVFSWSNRSSAFDGGAMLWSGTGNSSEDRKLLSWSSKNNVSDDGKTLSWSDRLHASNASEGRQMLSWSFRPTSSDASKFRNSAMLSWSSTGNSSEDEKMLSWSTSNSSDDENGLSWVGFRNASDDEKTLCRGHAKTLQATAVMYFRGRIVRM
eukprot:TRINITY_DN1093_c0_g1_i2.p1 TRINITY_DN1093_c0_g1~~TRINITY_DN1093_c0_g1_i2.p1  ORF type:complete len:462 (-),score=84.97 TRINITY_DN1093_c0_g1_i2:800-2185(-)